MRPAIVRMSRGAWAAPSRAKEQPGVWQPRETWASAHVRDDPAAAAKMARSSATTMGRVVRSKIREQVAPLHLAKAGLRSAVERNHLLRRSIGAATEETHRVAIAEFREWLEPRTATTGADLDKYLPKYADHLFFNRDPPSKFRNVLYARCRTTAGYYRERVRRSQAS